MIYEKLQKRYSRDHAEINFAILQGIIAIPKEAYAQPQNNTWPPGYGAVAREKVRDRIKRIIKNAPCNSNSYNTGEKRVTKQLKAILETELEDLI